MTKIDPGGGSGPRPTAWWIVGLGADPAPGDAFSPTLLGSQFRGIAENAQYAHRGLFGLLEDPALTSWMGKSGEAFYRACEPFPTQLALLQRAYEEAADALDKYQTVFADAQGRADAAYYQAHYAAAGMGFSDDDFHGLAGLGDQAYVDAAAKILLTRQKPDPPQDPDVPHPSPGPAPGYVPLNNDSPISGQTQGVLNQMINARRDAVHASQDLDGAAAAFQKAIGAAAEIAVNVQPWQGTAVGPYGGGTFDQRFAAFGGDPADLHIAASAGADVTAAQDPSQAERYDACRDFIFQHITDMMNSDQFKNIQELLREMSDTSWYAHINTSPGDQFEAALAMWAAMVGPGQPWDFKGPITNLLGGHKPQPGEIPYYTRFGEDPNTQLYMNIWANISYGYVGRAAGFDEGTLQHGAQLNAIFAGTNTEGNQVGRQIGIDLFTHYPPGTLTQQAIDDEIYAHLDQLAPYSEFQHFPSDLKEPPPPDKWKGGDRFNPLGP